MRILDYGERALLLEVEPERVSDYLDTLLELDLPDIVSVVPAAQTLLVEVRSATAVGPLRYQLEGIEPSSAGQRDLPEVQLDITYDGPDLSWVAEQTGLTIDEVIEAHSGSTYRVQFCGFSPGFGYLSGLDERLHLPRRQSPRTSVPAGSVSIANAYSAVYTATTPGGWHLLGRTETKLFDAALFDRGESPAVFQPGVIVRFVPR